jgi:glyoxylase-like metal-dependent hydrolase (beta-lactamase superfamily II)
MRGTRPLFSLTTFPLVLTWALLASPHPASAQLPPGMKAFETTKVADGVYSFRYFFYRNMFVVTNKGVIATDPINPKAAKILLQEIRKVTDKPIKYVIYSHNHWDHILGGKVLKKAGARIIAHENCIAHFKRRPHPDLAMPDGTYKRRHEIRLGGRTVELLYFGRNHGDCLTVMRLPKEKILFIVDLVTPKRVAFRFMPDFYPGDWVRSLKEIEKLDFERVIPGHGPPVVGASAVREQRQYLEDLMAAVKEAHAKNPDPDKVREMVKLPKYERWGAFNLWLGMNVERIWAYYHMGW